MLESMTADTITMAGQGGDPLDAYLAMPLGEGPFGGVVVIHHMPGWDRPTKEIARRLAAEGYNTLCPNLYSREAPGASPEEAFAVVRAAGGIPDERFVADTAAAADYLRALPSSNGKVGIIGYCSGGRHAFLAACSLQLDAAVDCYGGGVVGPLPDGAPATMVPVVHRAPGLSCPLLGLFGAEDQHPTPGQVAELHEALTAAAKDFTFHVYPGAGHAFFHVERPSFRPEVAKVAWGEIVAFFGTHLT